ncbi:thiosulfate sulfurtransferase GlpE [Echinimonas agarilytica]|uniref:Thiosulfate sulfurtransferase GlpE n=1 Tax=Echinimonas agarilytica TaxID=1215918 RepID=A0AA41W907_9GAMM|nr:thiosulfate sulfurtransferase GlpE [Echinimonas agarilytica]MCM2680926.1 thiosulfate sulfurtransferase GlpE [Echinimonas agarilytica]
MSAFQHISPADACQLMKDHEVQIADIRDPKSFSTARMQGAQSLNNDNVSDFVLNGEFENPLIVCCYHGISSQPAAEFLASQGFEQVYSLDGGFDAWSQQFPELMDTDA